MDEPSGKLFDKPPEQRPELGQSRSTPAHTLIQKHLEFSASGLLSFAAPDFRRTSRGLTQEAMRAKVLREVRSGLTEVIALSEAARSPRQFGQRASHSTCSAEEAAATMQSALRPHRSLRAARANFLPEYTVGC